MYVVIEKWRSTPLTTMQGTQMYFGGQAFVIILNSIFPTFLRMKNTLPERLDPSEYPSYHTNTHLLCSAGITTPGLIGFVLFMILYFPIIYFIPAYKIQKLLEVQVIVATATLLGIMAWAVHVSSISMFAIGLDFDFITGERW
jgi:nucleobase:cation symporter-1, NCS1 family